MNLILFRHGQAVERESYKKSKKDDSLRPLTLKGKEKTKIMGKKLRGMVPEISLILSSPYMRSIQTAELLKQVCKLPNYNEIVELVPSAPASALAHWLKTAGQSHTSILCVGHEPHLSTFASWCLSGASESFINLKKSGMLSLEIENLSLIQPGMASLSWLLQPALK